MNTKPILESEYASLRISALPSRPTASSAFGGKGYTATQLKEAFDRIPLLLIERFNRLLSDIGGTGQGSLAAEIPTGLESGHTLQSFFDDVKSGTLATYLSVDGISLAAALDSLEQSLAQLRADAESGALSQYLSVDGEALQKRIAAITQDIEALKALASDAESGALASYLRVDDQSLTDALSVIRASLEDANEAISDLKSDLRSGAAAAYLSVGEKTLSECLRVLTERIGVLEDAGIDGGSPKERT